MFKVFQDGGNLNIFFGDELVIAHSAGKPFMTAGKGEGSFLMKGDKSIHVSDKIIEKVPLVNASYDQERALLRFAGGEYSVAIHISENENGLSFKFKRFSEKINRLFLSFPASPEIAVYGCGDHTGPMDLRGQKILSWVNPGKNHGKNKNALSFIREIIQSKNVKSSALTTPFFIRSDLSYMFIDTAAYTVMDFSDKSRHTAEIWGVPENILVGKSGKYQELAEQITKLFGRQTILPQWSWSGVWLDTAGGTSKIVETLERAIKTGVKISAIIVRDWCSGSNKTFWDWSLNTERYPRLDELMRKLLRNDVHMLAYINPHLSIEGRLFAEASKGGYLVKNAKNGNLLTDMGGFMTGLIDLTNPEACLWYKQIVKENIIRAGFSGFIADMGEFLPEGAVFKDGSKTHALHNKWPLMWARLNREAIRETGRPDIMFLSRSGYSGSSGEVMAFSLSGQKPTWEKTDGFPNAISASLSAGICGIGVVSSKIGGEPGGTMHKCSKELFMRWTEFSAFTPVMEVSIGTDSDCGLSFDSDEEINGHFARLSRIHHALSPYFKHCMKITANEGIPVMRPLSLSFPEDIKTYELDDEYLLGDDMLIAPVIQKNRKERTVYLPKGDWIHLWTGREYSASNPVIEAPFGMPPVFYKAKSKFNELFVSVTDIQ